MEKNVTQIRKLYSQSIFKMLDRNAEFNEYRQLLFEMKDKGINRDDIYSFFSEIMLQMRELKDEQKEERMIEVLDIVSGFCSVHLKVWSD